MKSIFHFGLAALLTPAVFIGMSCIDPLARLVGSDSAWAALTPVFRLFGIVGTEGEENVMLAALVIVSFAVATTVVWIALSLIQRIRAGQAPH